MKTNDYAKREELGSTTLELEKAQAEIRYAVKQATIHDTIYPIVTIVINGIVDKYTRNIEDEGFRTKAETSLRNYATVQYRKMQELTRGIDLDLLLYAVAISTGTISAQKQAAQALLRVEPNILPSATKTTPYVEIAQPMKEWSETYMKRVRSAWGDLANSEAKDSYSDNVSLRNVAEMKERYEKKQREIQDLIDSGEDLTWISEHANCSKRCQKWQGKLYSLSGRSGTIDGISFQPLTNAMNVYYTTKAGKVYKNGCISGYNCRHRLTPYRKGNKPIHVDAETIKKAREINDAQRAYERKIRDAKALAIGNKDIDKAAAKAYRIKARKLTEEYQAYSRRNNVAFYPSRCQVFDGEELISPRYRRLLSI